MPRTGRTRKDRAKARKEHLKESEAANQTTQATKGKKQGDSEAPSMSE